MPLRRGFTTPPSTGSPNGSPVGGPHASDHTNEQVADGLLTVGAELATWGLALRGLASF